MTRIAQDRVYERIQARLQTRSKSCVRCYRFSKCALRALRFYSVSAAQHTVSPAVGWTLMAQCQLRAASMLLKSNKNPAALRFTSNYVAYLFADMRTKVTFGEKLVTI